MIDNVRQSDGKELVIALVEFIKKAGGSDSILSVRMLILETSLS